MSGYKCSHPSCEKTLPMGRDYLKVSRHTRTSMDDDTYFMETRLYCSRAHLVDHQEDVMDGESAPLDLDE